MISTIAPLKQVCEQQNCITIMINTSLLFDLLRDIWTDYSEAVDACKDPHIYLDQGL